MRILSYCALLCLAAAAALPAAELALLSSGATLRIERHEARGDRIRLYTSADGFVELPAAAVAGFQPIAQGEPKASEAAPRTTPPEPSLDELVDDLAAEFGLHPALIHSVIAAESNYQADAVSHKGAIGLMQLMPATAQQLQVDPYEPSQNVLGGVKYLRAMLERYRGKPDQLLRALAAYNAGPEAVDRYDGPPPYEETQDYIVKVIRRFLRRAERAVTD